MTKRKNIYNHLTAKKREKLSFPVRWMQRNGILKGTMLDYGCGFGSDVEFLQKMGYSNLYKFDKYYYPQLPKKSFDTIICSYVLNVLEKQEQSEVLMQISELLNDDGRAYFAVRRDIKYEGYRLHKIHKQYTFQNNVILPFRSIFKNEFVEIYEYQKYTRLNHAANNCPFCSPDKSLKLLTESAQAFAVFDNFPVSQGHSLVIVKRHIADYFSLNSNQQMGLWLMVSRVKKLLQQKYHPDGYNVGFNVNEDAGQSIFHTHIHIIPRYKGDMKNPKGGVRHVIPEKGNY
jgi:diadenosine tetraphosphate (Ap4A) HIT family hydrolase